MKIFSVILLATLFSCIPLHDEDTEYVTVTVENNSPQSFVLRSSMLTDGSLDPLETSRFRFIKGDLITARGSYVGVSYKRFYYDDEYWVLN